MPVVALAGSLAVAIAVVFLLEPLVRPAEDLREPDPRRRAADRREDAGGSTATAERPLAARTRRCPDCGRRVERPYDYCGDCLCPLPA